MAQVFISLIEKLPTEYIMLVVTALVVLGIMTLPKLRRDKHGKWYVFSRKYQVQKDTLKEIKAALKAHEASDKVINDAIQQDIETSKKDREALHGLLESTHSDMKASNGELLKNCIEICKMSFYNSNMGITDRLAAGFRYVFDYDCNGDTKRQVLEMAAAHPEVAAALFYQNDKWKKQYELLAGGEK